MESHLDNYFFQYNRILDEKLDECIHNVERQIDRLYKRKTDLHYYGCFDDRRSYHDSTSNNLPTASSSATTTRAANPFSTATYSQFGRPYIRDFRNFSPPLPDDVRQISELTGNENIEQLIEIKAWTKDSKQQLLEAVLDFYATSHTVRLIKQEEILIKNAEKESRDKQATSKDTDFKRSLKLIEEQKEQVKNRKDPRIFVPEDRLDPNVDWCQISAKLSKTLHDVQDCRLLWQNQLHWTINNNFWSKEEDDCLLKAVEKHGKNDWDSISRELNSNRLPWQCCARFQQEFAKSGQSPINQDDADKILDVINLCKIGNYVPWNQVMYFIKFYSLSQVKYQWNKLIYSRGTGKPWTNEEDHLLLNCIERFGIRDWSRIANCIPGRSNRSCRERYVMRLKFDKRSIGKWNSREDIKLLAYVDRFGTNWAPVSSHFPDRNEHQLRNRYEILRMNPAGSIRRGAIKHRKVIKSIDGLSIQSMRIVKKPSSEIEIDRKLMEIFSSYHNIKTTQKSLVCRSGLDESIYQNLSNIMKAVLTNQEQKGQGSLTHIIIKALDTRVFFDCDILTPNYSTLQGYKAWFVQHGYLNQLVKGDTDINNFTLSNEYENLRDIVVSLFLWPALLAKLTPTEFDTKDLLNRSIIERDSKNLFKIREIQKNLGTN